MKQYLFPVFISIALLGCSSTNHSSQLDSEINLSSVKTMGDTTRYVWYTEKGSKPQSAADYVVSGDYGWYKSNYRWDGGELREMKREGFTQQINSSDQKTNELIPFNVHIRFNKQGEAVYQQYRLNGRVLALQKRQRQGYRVDAKQLVTAAKLANDNGQRLIQGRWDGTRFETCKGKPYHHLDMNPPVTTQMAERLNNGEHQLRFRGQISKDRIEVNDLAFVGKKGSCIERPVLELDGQKANKS